MFNSDNIIPILIYTFIALIFVIIPALAMSLHLYKANRDKKDKEYCELIYYVGNDYREFIKKYENTDISDDKLLRMYFSNKSNYYKAKKKKEEEEELERDTSRKQKITMRAYSYKYEEMLYEIFAPVTEIAEDTRFYIGTLPIDHVVNEISKKLMITNLEAENLMEEFVRNRLLDYTMVKQNEKWVRGKSCRLGNTLKYDWGVISKNDLNIARWIKVHPKIINNS